MKHYPADEKYPSGWDKSKDTMSGVEEYGKETLPRSAWSIKFDHLDFEEIKVVNGDKSPSEYSKTYSKYEFINDKGY